VSRFCYQLQPNLCRVRCAVGSGSRIVGAAAALPAVVGVFMSIRSHVETFLIGIGLRASVAYVIATIIGALGTAATGAVVAAAAYPTRTPDAISDGSIIGTMSLGRGPRRAVEQSLEPGGDVIPP